jgi:hypothetical protein
VEGLTLEVKFHQGEAAKAEDAHMAVMASEAKQT